MTAAVALLRGVNVGTAKRVPMEELRRLLVSLGFADVRTLLNSGNAVFTVPRASPSALARAIEDALATRFGFDVPVVVHTASELDAIVAENPLRQASDDPARFLVAFAGSPKELAKVRPLVAQACGREALAIGRRAAYLWCAEGIADGVLLKAFRREAGTVVTARNWTTVLKLQAALTELAAA